MKRLWPVLVMTVALAGCVTPAVQQQVIQVSPSPSPGGRRIASDGAGGYILPDGSVVRGDGSGGFTLPNGAYVAANAAGGVTLPNGAQCVTDGAGGYLCP